MKKNIIFPIVYLLAFLVVVANLVFIVKDAFFDDLNSLPEGEFLYSSMAPDNNTTISVYRVSAPFGNAVRAECLLLSETGTVSKRNVFWQTGTETAIVGWLDNNTVTINSKNINLLNGEIFDSRYQK